MKKCLISAATMMLAIIMLAGCGQAPTVTITTLPATAAPPPATHSVTPSVLPSPTVIPTPAIEPSPTVIPTPTPTIEPTPTPIPTVKPSPTPEPTPKPTLSERVFVLNTDIPDIIEGDGRNLGGYYEDNYYEDDENLYCIDYEDSVIGIDKTTKEYDELFIHCVDFCVEGDYIYWIGIGRNHIPQINKYDIKSKVNTAIYSTENLHDIHVYNGRIYFTKCRNPGDPRDPSIYDLYSMDINGGNIEKLIELVDMCFIIYNNNIFYVSCGDKTSICMYNTDSRNITELVGKYSTTFSTAYGKLYYYDVDERCVASIDIASGEKKVFKDANYNDEIVVLGQYLFYFVKYGNDEDNYKVGLRAYDIINDKYYNITSKYFPTLGASNKNLYFREDGPDEYSIFLKSLKIYNGKASVKLAFEFATH